MPYLRKAAGCAVVSDRDALGGMRARVVPVDDVSCLLVRGACGWIDRSFVVHASLVQPGHAMPPRYAAAHGPNVPGVREHDHTPVEHRRRSTGRCPRQVKILSLFKHVQGASGEICCPLNKHDVHDLPGQRIASIQLLFCALLYNI